MTSTIETSAFTRGAGHGATGTVSDTKFCLLTERGHRALGDGDLDRAETCFRNALDEVERLFDEAESARGTAVLLAPMMFTIGCRNLAAARERAGDATGAWTHMESAVERLLDVAAHAGQPPALRLNCLRHLRYALGFLVEFGGPHGVARFEQLAERTACVGQEVIRVATLCRSPEMRAQGVRLS